MAASVEESEHDHRHDRPVKFYVNRREVEIWERSATGREIKKLADIPEEFKLFAPDGREIGNDATVELHDGERFTAISGQDVS